MRVQRADPWFVVSLFTFVTGGPHWMAELTWPG